MSSTDTTARRSFLGGMMAAAAGATLPLAEVHAASAPPQGGHDDWLNRITGRHKCLFDFPQHKKGAGLVHIRNYALTYRDAYGASMSDISTIGTFYSVGPDSSVALAFNDAMWTKYAFGEYTHLDDLQTGRPAVRNLFAEYKDGDEIPRVGPVGPFPDATISKLQSNMGTTFLLCNNSVSAVSMDLAQQGKGTAETIATDLLANVLPGVILVPAMVIAIEKAQAAGISYNKQ